MKPKYLILKNGKFLTSVFNGGKFEVVGVSGAYAYNVKDIAEDVARQFDAAVVEVRG